MALVVPSSRLKGAEGHLGAKLLCLSAEPMSIVDAARNYAEADKTGQAIMVLVQYIITL